LGTLRFTHGTDGKTTKKPSTSEQELAATAGAKRADASARSHTSPDASTSSSSLQLAQQSTLSKSGGQATSVGGGAETEIPTSNGSARNSKTTRKAHNSSICDASAVVSGAAMEAAQASTLIATTGMRTLSDKDEFHCPHSLLLVGDGHRIKCDICTEYYHQKCTLMTSKVFNKFIVHADITGWVCNDCKAAARSSFWRLKAAISHLAEQVAELKSELQQTKATTERQLCTSTAPPPVAPVVSPREGSKATIATSGNVTEENKDRHTTLIMQRTINDSNRRKRNIVVSGLPDSDDDRSSFLALCESHLPIKPAITDSCCIWLGKAQHRKIRGLLVKLKPEETATSLLGAAPIRRHSWDRYVANNIDINADSSPAAAPLAYEARRIRRIRAAMTAGEQGCTTATETTEVSMKTYMGIEAVSEPELQACATFVNHPLEISSGSVSLSEVTAAAETATAIQPLFQQTYNKQRADQLHA
jgi:hypothetical protein